MISRDDCIGLSGLSEEEVQALAEHEHIPEILAAAFAHHLLCQADGCRKIAAMIADDVGWAVARGDSLHADQLRKTLNEFIRDHPEGWASLRARACLGRGTPIAA